MVAKLDGHADLIKRLYAECGNAQDTWERLRGEGVKTSYESVRSWLKKHAVDLPPLRSGGGKPKSAKPEQLFGFIPNNIQLVPDADVFPEFFHALTPQASHEYKAAFLTSFLVRFGIETTINELEVARLPLKRFRRLCDLELYLLAYLLGRHGALVGVTTEEFGAQTRAITPMAASLREVIWRRNSITVEELRKLIRQ